MIWNVLKFCILFLTILNDSLGSEMADKCTKTVLCLNWSNSILSFQPHKCYEPSLSLPNLEYYNPLVDKLSWTCPYIGPSTGVTYRSVALVPCRLLGEPTGRVALCWLLQFGKTNLLAEQHDLLFYFVFWKHEV